MFLTSVVFKNLILFCFIISDFVTHVCDVVIMWIGSTIYPFDVIPFLPDKFAMGIDQERYKKKKLHLSAFR